MLNKMKIKTRLLSGFAAVLALLVLIGVLAISVTWKVAGNYNSYIENGETAISAAKESRALVFILATDVRNLVINQDPSLKKEILDRVNKNELAFQTEYEKLNASYAETINGIDEITQIQSDAILRFGEAVQAWMNSANEIVAYADSGDYDKAGRMILEVCTPQLEKVSAIADEIQADLDFMTATQIESIRMYANVASFFMFGVMLVICVLVIWMALRISASIIKPIREVQDAALEMSKGNLHHVIKYTSNDGVGQLADSLRDSMSVLSAYVDDIDKAMESMSRGNFDVAPSQEFIGDFKNIETSITRFVLIMSRTLEEIRESVSTMEAATQNVSEGAVILSNGATTQASSVEELSNAISEVSAKVNYGSERSQQARETVNSVGGELAASNDQMSKMVSAMGNISNSSSEIGKIIKTIEDIAFQTNILALNAAVEAARAGAAGKGFAVVADEVRNLASKSAEAAKGTTKMIGDSQGAIAVGEKIVEQTSKSLYQVEEGAKSVTDIIGEIATASKAQAEAIVQVTQEIAQISDIVQTNAATAEESAAASNEIASQARELEKRIEFFVLKNSKELEMIEKALKESGKL